MWMGSKMMVHTTSRNVFVDRMWPVRPLNSASSTSFSGKTRCNFSTIERGAAQHVFFNFVNSGICTTSSFL